MTTRPTKTETLAEEDDVQPAESQADALPVTKLRRERKKSQPKRAGCLAGKDVQDKPVPRVEKQPRGGDGGEPPIDYETVVMAVRDIPPGKILDEKDVKEVRRPRKSPKDAATSVEQVKDHSATKKIGAGAIVTTKMVSGRRSG